ncbi:antiviral reverse transcriptase Drt3b [Raoultella ornithinolytica]|uniref:antiviral reverse transcriptase Drt3b n=1 Tax=Raoultella ornithinolytica TaxID=54291 RepID=UPI001F425C1B|nr:antiviral reverse transcriptase Drt3b [Raoultella ornithinolytica]MCF1301927.1 RNA-directed DNA polymerase [Raoultella ornithinolytica]
MLEVILTKYIKLVKNDFNRVILTDVLPYELPFIFTNEGFYHALKNKTIKENPILEKIFLTYEDRKPFEYYIKKDKNSDRKLYLIHPSNQSRLTDIYKKYSSLITHLCSRSSFSLRAPSSIASLYYEKHPHKPHDKYKDEGVEGDIEETTKYASSFFKYKKYDFLYKFYDSYEFHKIEKKFHSLLKLDISKCFDSISTSMLVNSLRSEVVAKEAKKHNNFEKEFATVMEQSNYGRTHGIVIGPESSRIFAEILLQSIDIEIKETLSILNIEEGNDYIIKRYVDDYFLFYNTEKIREKVLHSIKTHLEKYKLYCNESKYLHYNTPIITSVTSAKIKIQEKLEILFDVIDKDKTISSTENDLTSTPHHNISIIKNLNRHDLLANRAIRDIKCVIKDSGVDFNSITGYFFTLIRIKSSDLDENFYIIDNEIQEERLCRFILIILELSFFMYSMDLRVRSTYLLSQIIIILHRLSDKLRDEKRERVLKKINDESNSILSFFIKNKPVHNLEILNLIITLGVFFDDNKISSNRLKEILGIGDNSAKYFELMVGLFYIKKDPIYSTLKKSIINKILHSLDDKNTLEDSEKTHIFFDSLSCPCISKKNKTKILKLTLERNNINIDDQSNLLESLSKQTWFIEWSKEASVIEKLLLKKELRTPYGH